MENNLKDQHYKNMGITLQMDTLAFEAESVAYVVCQHYGIDTAEYSFPYVAGWSSDKEVPELKASLDTIRRAATDLIVQRLFIRHRIICSLEMLRQMTGWMI